MLRDWESDEGGSTEPISSSELNGPNLRSPSPRASRLVINQFELTS